MGLDVVAYRKINKLEVVFDSKGEPINPYTKERYDDYFIAYISMNFSDQAAGLEDRAVYSYAEAKCFWSDRYENYSGWREQLAKLAGYASVADDRAECHPARTPTSYRFSACAVIDGPFRELLCFSDCEGVIGAPVAAKLARDFAEWDERAKAIEDAWFYEKYTEWRQCFDMAADNGAVSFS